jgi:hypothetical protein
VRALLVEGCDGHDGVPWDGTLERMNGAILRR